MTNYISKEKLEIITKASILQLSSIDDEIESGEITETEAEIHHKIILEALELQAVEENCEEAKLHLICA